MHGSQKTNSRYLLFQGNAEPDLGAKNESEIFSFLKTLLHTLSIVLTGDATNQAYFRHDIHFSTLSETLQACHFIEGERVVELCDYLLNMGVKGMTAVFCLILQVLGLLLAANIFLLRSWHLLGIPSLPQMT